jgi:S-adenosylmethionine-diacylglycerol 3-amino-3-carboxypropyl transferase
VIFNYLLNNKLIFNTCWEDPRLDRYLLKINENDRILTIASAGCNSIEYLLDKPNEIISCDINSSQIALSELKKVLFEQKYYSELEQMFALGHKSDFNVFLNNNLQNKLSSDSYDFWLKHKNYFTSKKSFYHRGMAGRGAGIILKIFSKETKDIINKLFDSRNLHDLAEQEKYYNLLEKKLWNPIILKILNSYLIYYFLGVPKNQFKNAKKQNNSIHSYLVPSLKKTFTQTSVQENYFWRIYARGSYSQKCRPEYLKHINHAKITQNINKLILKNKSILDVLQENDTIFDCINLLDHQDWYLANHSDYLNILWAEIAKKTKSGSRIIFRSAMPNADFLPKEFHTSFELQNIKNDKDLPISRVGTYASVHLALRI